MSHPVTTIKYAGGELITSQLVTTRQF